MIARLAFVLIASILANVIWFALVARVGPTPAATFHFLNPFFGVIMAYLLLGEPITTIDWIGVGIIMVGILAVQIARTRAA